MHRITNAVASIPVLGRPLRMILWIISCRTFGSEIAIGTVLGGGAYIPHPYGIVIGKAQIGKHVHILQNVTIGSVRQGDVNTPIISDQCKIGAGSVIIGGVTIGKSANIGANAVVVRDIPEGATAVGIPARIL